MKYVHTLCPLCKKEHLGLCQTCLQLILFERKSSFMLHHCNLCGAHLLHTDSICTKEKSSFRYTIFDNTSIIQSLKESFKIYYYDEFIIQLGTIYLQEIKRIEPLLFPDCMFQQVEKDNSYTPYFNKLIEYINKVGQQNHVKERYPLVLTIGESNSTFKTLSLY